MKLLLLLMLLFTPMLLGAAESAGTTLPVSSTQRIDQLAEGAIHKGLISGAVVLIGNSRKNLFAKGYGRVTTAADARPMTTDTIFDIASLTKVIATTPSILKLAEERKLSLVDPVKKWFPEFEGKGKDELLILNLLTHTSALNDFSLDSVNPLQSAIAGAANQKLNGEIGNRFHYADINFILLAAVVQRSSGAPLDEYAAAKFYGPLGMKDTAFRPAAENKPRIAATAGDGPHQFCGEPQDYLCRQLGGVAGHAGLFSTAADLALFCRMILGNGQLDGKRVMEQRTVNQMTAPYFSRGGKVVRGLGWDIASPFSSPRGSFFSRGSFGHTGYSGSSVWIDPDADLYVILLTTRLEYRKKTEFSELRSALSTLAVEAFGSPLLLRELEELVGDQGEMKRVVVVDVETSGLSAGNGGRVIEIGAVAIAAGEITAEFATLIAVDVDIHYGAQRVHGISKTMLQGEPEPDRVWADFIDFVGDTPLVAHNYHFDRGFILHELGLLGHTLPNHWHCTLRLARKLLPQLDNHRLATVATALLGDIPADCRLHRALGDARLTSRVWVELQQRSRFAHPC